MHPLAGRRCHAYALDAVGYVGIAAAMVPLGVIAHRAGRRRHRGYLHAVSAIPPVLATLLAAGQEAGRSQATWGKRRCRLTVADRDGAPVAFGRTLLRNTVKIAIPWQLGHVVAIGAASGGFGKRDIFTLAATLVTYPLLGLMIGSVMTRSGSAVHDRLAGTCVLADSGIAPGDAAG